MLQAALKRLRSLWPNARISVLTEDPDALRLHCSGVEPLLCSGRALWFADRNLLGRAHRLLPDAASRLILRTQDHVRNCWPSLFQHVISLRFGHQLECREAALSFARAFQRADLIVVTGAGGITDHAINWAWPVLRLLQGAVESGVPAAMFSHGLGPLTNPKLMREAGEVLPRLSLLALRESRAGLALAEALGVEPASLAVTGDDAVEMAYVNRPLNHGPALGVNLRISSSAHTDREMLSRLKPVLHALGHELQAPLLPLPVSFHQRNLPPSGSPSPRLPDLTDAQVLAQLEIGLLEPSDGGQSINTPQKLIEVVGQCRLVITGAYHAAVFALSQGVPAVCLANSTYFADKFLGLADQFGVGCEVISLNSPDLPTQLRTASLRLWRCASPLRPALLEAAQHQAQSSRDAYAKLHQLVASAAGYSQNALALSA